jgi:hypothetical protein
MYNAGIVAVISKVVGLAPGLSYSCKLLPKVIKLNRPQIADEEIRFANGLNGPSSSDSSCNTSPLSALLHTTNGNNSPLASLNTPGQGSIS